LTEQEITIREPSRVDLPALGRFAAAVPAHDLLFLARDIREPRVLDAWIAGVEAGEIVSLVALANDDIVATLACVSDPLSWSRHVWDIRLLVATRAWDANCSMRRLQKPSHAGLPS
jgi:hypothetical protein